MRTGALVAITCLTACAADEVAPGPPYRADVIEIVGVDPTSGVGEFELVERELWRLDDLEAMEGPELAVRRGGELVIRDIAGSVVIDGRFEAGGDPELRYAVEGGVVVPLDYPTLTMLSAYHQFSIVLDRLGDFTELSADQLIERTGRLEAYFEPVVRLDSELDASVIIKLNAFYLPGRRQFGLARRVELEGVPFAANLKVIAHEFGHALFEQIFHGGPTQPCAEADVAADPLSTSRLVTEYALAGFNEGIGDFVSFTMTGSVNPLAELAQAGLAVEDRNLAGEDFVYDDLEGGQERPTCTGSFYCIGTLWARALRRAAIALGHDVTSPGERDAFSRQVFAALARTRGAIADQGLLPAPTASVEGCETNRSHDHDARVTSAFLAAFLTGMPDGPREALCGELAAQFGAAGFSPEARAAARCPAEATP